MSNQRGNQRSNQRVIKSHISKDIQYNDQNKQDNDLQSTTQKTKRKAEQLNILWLSYISPLVLLLPKIFKLSGFPIFRILAYIMKVIPETRRAH
jgi:hypothetical protein